ncbi:MAG TPA: hypothetical protein VFB13_16570 [Reyranella sp.]|jgi:hypothetical protein|nr:hypothetical protein [Reyranella sp.]
MRRLTLLLAFLTIGPAASVFAQQFGPGQHVLVGSTGETGTVLQVGQTTPDGGVMLKVRLDKPGGPTEADRDVWYNSRSSKLSLAPATATPAAPAAPAQPAAAKTQLQAGDRVRIGSLGVNGTVVQVLGVLGNGSQMVRVEIDKNAPKYPGMSNMYDTLSSQITPLN